MRTERGIAVHALSPPSSAASAAFGHTASAPRRRRPPRARPTSTTWVRCRLRNDAPDRASSPADDDHERRRCSRPLPELGGARPSWSAAPRTSPPSTTASVPSAACAESAMRERLQRGPSVDLAGVAARMRAEDDAAAGPLRRAGGALAGAAGALLAPRLGARRRRRGRGSWSTCVPWRRAASSAFTTSCTSASFRSSAEHVGGELGLRAAGDHGCGRSGRPSAVAPDLDDRRPIAPGHGAPRPAAGSLGVDVGHAQAALGDPLVAHVARHPHALEHARGVRRRADRARRADVVRAVLRGRGGSCAA